MPGGDGTGPFGMNRFCVNRGNPYNKNKPLRDDVDFIAKKDWMPWTRRGNAGNGWGNACRRRLFWQGNVQAENRSENAQGRNPGEPKRIASVDRENCAGCGVCVQFCPSGAIAVNGTADIDNDKCIGCGMCAEECPNKAIVLTDKDRHK